jgi:hypothetical protein
MWSIARAGSSRPNCRALSTDGISSVQHVVADRTIRACANTSWPRIRRTVPRAAIAIGARVVEVQALWKEFHHPPDFPADVSPWNGLCEGSGFQIGGTGRHGVKIPLDALDGATWEQPPRPGRLPPDTARSRTISL